MKVRYLIAMTAALSVSTAAFAADDGAALFKKGGCNMCHSVDNKGVGPALKDIAAKYKGNKDAQATLEKKVRSGGAGVWGSVGMPPTPTSISNEDIKTMVQWVLSQK